MIRAGFAIPQVFPDGPVDVEEIRRIAQKAESIGYADLWVQEQIVGSSRSLEPVSLLSYLAAITSRVRLGTSVIVLPKRSPVQLAKSLGTLDVLSGGRITVGVGLGAEQNNEAFGIESGRIVRRFLDALHAMDALWTQDEAQYDSDFFRLNGAAMEPTPMQRPRPPIWFGARTDAALKRAARHADGWMGPGSSSAEDFKEHVASLRRHLEDRGRDPASFPISKRVYLAIDNNSGRAKRRLADWFGHHYRNPDMASRVSIWGSLESCVERIDAIIDAGADHLLLNPVFDYDDHLDALRDYAGRG